MRGIAGYPGWQEAGQYIWCGCPWSPWLGDHWPRAEPLGRRPPLSHSCPPQTHFLPLVFCRINLVVFLRHHYVFCVLLFLLSIAYFSSFPMKIQKAVTLHWSPLSYIFKVITRTLLSTSVDVHNVWGEGYKARASPPPSVLAVQELHLFITPCQPYCDVSRLRNTLCHQMVGLALGGLSKILGILQFYNLWGRTISGSPSSHGSPWGYIVNSLNFPRVWSPSITTVSY